LIGKVQNFTDQFNDKTERVNARLGQMGASIEGQTYVYKEFQGNIQGMLEETVGKIHREHKA